MRRRRRDGSRNTVLSRWIFPALEQRPVFIGKRQKKKKTAQTFVETPPIIYDERINNINIIVIILTKFNIVCNTRVTIVELSP